MSHAMSYIGDMIYRGASTRGTRAVRTATALDLVAVGARYASAHERRHPGPRARRAAHRAARGHPLSRARRRRSSRRRARGGRRRRPDHPSRRHGRRRGARTARCGRSGAGDRRRQRPAGCAGPARHRDRRVGDRCALPPGKRRTGDRRGWSGVRPRPARPAAVRAVRAVDRRARLRRDARPGRRAPARTGCSRRQVVSAGSCATTSRNDRGCFTGRGEPAGSRRGGRECRRWVPGPP